MISIDTIFEGYFDCRKNKRSSSSALEFEVNYEHNLLELCEQINNRTYTPSSSIAFVVMKPRPREIFAANFRDRILHHVEDLAMRPLLEKEFIATTCNNRIGKGTEGCVQYLDAAIKECSQNYTKDCWICKMDLKGFFMSISKSLLIKDIIAFLKEKYHEANKASIIWLLEKLLSDNPETHCTIKSPLSYWERLDKNKSLFHILEDLGLPIGNLISQLLANFYLNDFDHYVNITLAFKHFGRYVDDFYIVHQSKKKILEAIPLIRKKLAEIGCQLHPDKFYLQHYSKGVEMVGATIKPNRIYVNNRIVNNAFQKVKYLNKMKCTVANVEKLSSVVNSYLGFMKNRSAYNIRKKLIDSIDRKWHSYIYFDNNNFKIIIKKEFRQQKIIKNKLIKQRRKSYAIARAY